MKASPRPSKRLYLLLLLLVVAVAIGIYTLTGGRSLLGRVEKRPADKEENLVYGLGYTASSDCVLERDGIILVNRGGQVLARQLSTGIQLEAGSIAQRSQLPILRMAEHVGYLYLYDGAAVYRLNIGGDGKVHTAVKECLKFEPMGDYIYSLQEYRGQRWLFRSSLIGSNEKRLFDCGTQDFWAHGGDLLTLDSQGHYRWYNVVTQNSLEHILPNGLSHLTLSSGGILYLLEGGLHCRPLMGQTDTRIADGVLSFAAGPEHIAMLKEDGRIWLCRADGSEMSCLSGREFPDGTRLDVSAGWVFATLPGGEVWSASTEGGDWSLAFDPAA